MHFLSALQLWQHCSRMQLWKVFSHSTEQFYLSSVEGGAEQTNAGSALKESSADGWTLALLSRVELNQIMGLLPLLYALI